MDSRLCRFCNALLEPGDEKCPRCGADVLMQKPGTAEAQRQEPNMVTSSWENSYLAADVSPAASGGEGAFSQNVNIIGAVPVVFSDEDRIPD